ncbi:MAG: ComF family protein [Nitrospirae bacterium]|nr:ComF family protein [Nitrospirota bacterium]
MNPLSLLLNLFYPSVCCGCKQWLHPWRRGDLPVCPDCLKKIKRLDGPCCPCCGRPFASESALRHSPDHLCGRCRKRRPHYDRVFSGWEYEGAMREMIHRFKYRKRLLLGKKLSRHFIQGLNALPPADGILPVPLHSKRLREREFNQSLVMARVIAKAHRIPLFPDLLIRVRPTPPQVELSHAERIRNMKRAFEIKRGADVRNKQFILVDDVLTSGSTVNECARVLKKAGAEKVYVVTLARTPES